VSTQIKSVKIGVVMKNLASASTSSTSASPARRSTPTSTKQCAVRIADGEAWLPDDGDDPML
jgi:hypothetical protein